MQKNKTNFIALKNTPLFQWVLSNIKNGLDALKKDKPSIVVLVVATIIFMYIQVTINSKKSNGLLRPGEEGFLGGIVWIVMAMAIFWLTLTFSSRVYKVFDIKSMFTAVIMVGSISIIAIGVAKTMWLFTGGLQTKTDLVFIQSLCSSPTPAQNTTHCEDCENSVIIYNMDDKNFYSDNTNYNFETVNRLNEARYVICVDSTARLKETCKYQKGGEYALKYESLRLRMFSLATGKQKGKDVTLVAAPPICPLVVLTSASGSDFPYLTKVDKNLMYKSIKDMLEQ